MSIRRRRNGQPRFATRAIIMAALAAACSPAVHGADALAEGFRNPPAEARPQTLWFWMNGHVSRDGITRDLEAMRRVGVGGAMMFDGGTYLPAGPHGYMSPEWRELMKHAVQEADRLGLELGMHNGPGWSSSGGPWITPELSMQQLVWTETAVRGGRRVEVALKQPLTLEGFYRDAVVLAFPTPPAEQRGEAMAASDVNDSDLSTSVVVAGGEYLEFAFATPQTICAITVNATLGGRFPPLQLEASDDNVTFRPVTSVSNPGRHGIPAPGTRNFPPVTARYFRLQPRSTADLAEVALHRTPRIEDWVFKANFTYRVGRQVEMPEATPTDGAIDPQTVRDVTRFLRPDGKLAWDAPEGEWTILRFGHTSTGHLNVSASAAGRGLECDKFSRAAVEFHFESVIGRVLADIGPLAGKSFSMVEIDSYEAGMQNWTASFPEEFERRNGYDLRAYLPAMTGRVMGDPAISERFLFDVRRTQADLMAENYYDRMGELCRARGLKFFVEGYGQGVFDELQVSGRPEFPMMEFWERTPWTPNRIAKMVSSAAHTYGKAIVAGESFTGEEQTARWQEYPYSLKIEGDYIFSLGLNQMFFHRFAHQPHPTAVPGMAMGPWGFHFDRTNTWFEQSGPWLSYLARSQYLLRQGTYVADVLHFVGERPPDVAQFAMPVVPEGYNFDLVNAEVLLTRARVEDGDIVLPEGARYRVLQLPSGLAGMTPELLRKLREFVRAGATVIGPRPAHSLTLRGFPAGEDEVRQLADELWADAPTAIRDRPLADVLREKQIAPDFTYVSQARDVALSWIHRRLSDGELYFIANRQRRSEEFVASFRVTGLRPEIWHPETGRMEAAVIHEQADGVTRMPMRLGPAESVFVVFRRAEARRVPRHLTKDGEKILDVVPPAPPVPSSPADTFTMSVWAKPDIDLRSMPREGTTGFIDETGKFYAIPAGEGDRMFGAGHVAAGLAIGRNGIYVIERASDRAPAVLVARMPIAGWTHVAVVYREGTPRLYVNGTLVREGLRSGRVVHPGIGSPRPAPETSFHFAGLASLTRASGLPPTPSQGRAFYFEGNMAPPVLIDRALTEREIAELFAEGLPPPELPRAIDLTSDADGRRTAMIWESGTYALEGDNAFIATVEKPMTVSGPWRVVFPPGRGAPTEIVLPQLESLHVHAEAGVRHFSGTATYERMLDVPAAWIGGDRRVVLDLGRVEVLAEVTLNGRKFDVLWKEPYRLDVTEAVRAGANALEIRVTNLWTNRLIGDEQLSAENEYETGNERGIVKLPEWYLQGQPKPAGGRTTFTTWKFFTAEEPLYASGLLGPVRLLNPVRRAF